MLFKISESKMWELLLDANILTMIALLCVISFVLDDKVIKRALKIEFIEVGLFTEQSVICIYLLVIF